MNTTAKIQDKGQVTIPTSVRKQAGISKGDLVKFTFSRGQIVITPKIVVDRSQFATADETPAQRRIINAQLAEGLEDIRKGRVSPKFDTVDQLLASMKAGHKNQLPRRTKSRSK